MEPRPKAEAGTNLVGCPNRTLPAKRGEIDQATPAV
jgi:hypothetical protein